MYMHSPKITSSYPIASLYMPFLICSHFDIICSTIIKLLVLRRPADVTGSHQFFHTAVSDAKSYIITSRLPGDVYRKFVEDTNSSHMTGFTFVIIGIIHLAGGKIAEGIAFWFLCFRVSKLNAVCFIY